MSSDADTDTSIDSRSSDFNDGAEAILKNTTSETRTAGKGVHCSRSATPQSHKDSCPGPGQSHGQGGPVYSCGCYAYSEHSKFELLTPRSRAFHRSVSNGTRRGWRTMSQAKEVAVRLVQCEYTYLYLLNCALTVTWRQ